MSRVGEMGRCCLDGVGLRFELRGGIYQKDVLYHLATLLLASGLGLDQEGGEEIGEDKGCYG